MSGIRIIYYGMDEPLTEKVFHAHFANPDNGGGKISSIHYPMFGGHAVIIFEELHSKSCKNKKNMCSILNISQCLVGSVD